MAKFYDDRYGYREQLSCDYRYPDTYDYMYYGGEDHHWEPRFNQGEYSYYEDQEPPFWQQHYSMPDCNNLQNEFATSFSPGGYQYSNDWENFSQYQDPPPPPPEQQQQQQPTQLTSEQFDILLQQMQQMNQNLQNMECSMNIMESREKEWDTRMRVLEKQLAEVASDKATSSNAPLTAQPFSNPSGDTHPVNSITLRSGKRLNGPKGREGEGEENEKSEGAVEKEKVDELEIEKKEVVREKEEKREEKERIEDACLIKLIKEYLASCGIKELEGKEALEKEKQSKEVYVPEFKEELLNTPLEVIPLPFTQRVEIVCPFDCVHEGSKTKQPGKGVKRKRRMSKLMLFPNYWKSRWRDTFDGTSTISGVSLRICARSRILVQGKDDLRPP